MRRPALKYVGESVVPVVGLASGAAQ